MPGVSGSACTDCVPKLPQSSWSVMFALGGVTLIHTPGGHVPASMHGAGRGGPASGRVVASELIEPSPPLEPPLPLPPLLPPDEDDADPSRPSCAWVLIGTSSLEQAAQPTI